jgi:hypothetical protein
LTLNSSGKRSQISRKENIDLHVKHYFSFKRHRYLKIRDPNKNQYLLTGTMDYCTKPLLMPDEGKLKIRIWESCKLANLKKNYLSLYRREISCISFTVLDNAFLSLVNREERIESFSYTMSLKDQALNSYTKTSKR